MSNELHVPQVSTDVNQYAHVNAGKPLYLIKLQLQDKKAPQYFLAKDRMSPNTSFAECKGFFLKSQGSEEDLINAVLTSLPQEKILDVNFPWTSIAYIRNLSFRTNK